MPGVNYDTAVEQLRSAATWCSGAQALAALKDRRAFAPLLRAYESSTEASKQCLLDAMDALDPTVGAHQLFDRGSAEERRLAVHLMELFPDGEHLSRLESALSDPEPLEPTFRRQVLRSLATQLQTPEWEAVMTRLLGSPDEAVRAQAIRSLVGRQTNSVRQALRAHLDHETNPTLRDLLEKANAKTG